jgi:alpha/beta superfamily hydrolase
VEHFVPRSEKDVIKLFSKAFGEDELVALRNLFYLRDIRGGQGERKTFRTILAWLGEYHPEHVIENLHNVVVFGRWDDLFALRKTNLWNTHVLPIINGVWNAEIKSDAKASLFWKWMPSNNTSSKEARNLAYRLQTILESHPRSIARPLLKCVRSSLLLRVRCVQTIGRRLNTVMFLLVHP